MMPFSFLVGLDNFWSLIASRVDRWFSDVIVHGIFLFSFGDCSLVSVVILEDIGFRLQGRYSFSFVHCAV